MEIQDSLTTLSAEIIKGFEELSSSVVSDAIDILALTSGGCLPYTIHPLHSYAKPLVGLITTVYAPDGTSLPIHLAMATHAQERILLISTNNHKNCAFLGDIQARLTALNGCKGIVLDGFVRDKDGMKDLDLPIYCTGTHPKRPGKADVGGINIPITIGHVKVRSGDLLIADNDGVIIIPQDYAITVLETAKKKDASDTARLQRVKEFNYNGAKNIRDFTSILTKDVADYVKENM